MVVEEYKRMLFNKYKIINRQSGFTEVVSNAIKFRTLDRDFNGSLQKEQQFHGNFMKENF